MSSTRRTPTGKYELTIRSKLLPKRVYLTFDDEAAAKTYGAQVDALLAAGVVPAGLVVDDTPHSAHKLASLLREWLNSGLPAASDTEVLALLVNEVGDLALSDLTYKWAEGWAEGLKRNANLAPSTVRKRVGSLSRALDWWMRSHPDVQVANPLRLLPRGFAVYTAADKRAAVALGGKPKVDTARAMRVTGDDLARVTDALNGVKRDDRERPVVHPDDAEFRMLFWLIFYTGCRLREAYTLTTGQVDLAARSITVKTSKQWHDNVKWRSVPIRKELMPLLTTWLDGRPDGLLFSFWNGEPEDLKRTTARLSSRFTNLFHYAKCEHLTEHDLRHETTCQWFEMRNASGQWALRESEILSIMGWAPGSKMAERYASFRASDIVDRVWG